MTFMNILPFEFEIRLNEGCAGACKGECKGCEGCVGCRGGAKVKSPDISVV